jgi:uncharacterized iron-regulated membrane protein
LSPRQRSGGPSRLRRAAVLWHRRLGLTVGLLFAVAAGTGALLAWQTQIDELVYGPAAPETTPGRVPIDEAIATASEARRNGRVVEIAMPPARDGANVYRVRVQPDDVAFDEYVDAGSARRVFWRPPHPIFSRVEDIHRTLIVGPIGHALVVGASAVALGLLALGLLAWWPRRGGWRRSVQIRGRRGLYALAFDVHRVAGVLALPGLVLLTATGLLLAFPSVTASIGSLFPTPVPPSPPALPTAFAEPTGELPSMEALVAAFETRTGEAARILRPPTVDDGPAEIEFDREGRRHVAWVDPRDGRELARREVPPTPFRLDEAGVARVHEAQVAGTVGRTILALSSLIGALLLPTGLITWWMRRTGRNRRFARPPS